MPAGPSAASPSAGVAALVGGRSVPGPDPPSLCGPLAIVRNAECAAPSGRSARRRADRAGTPGRYLVMAEWRTSARRPADGRQHHTRVRLYACAYRGVDVPAWWPRHGRWLRREDGPLPRRRCGRCHRRGVPRDPRRVAALAAVRPWRRRAVVVVRGVEVRAGGGGSAAYAAVMSGRRRAGRAGWNGCGCPAGCG